MKQLLAFLTVCMFSINTAFAQTAEGGVSATSELATRTNSLKVQVLGPENGLITNIAEVLRPGSYAAVLDNLHMLKNGIWSVRDTGWTRERSSDFNSGGEFHAFSTHQDNTSEHFLFAVNGKVYDYNLSTHTETLIYTGTLGTGVQGRGSGVSYSTGYWYWVAGTARPQRWTGTGSTSNASGFPVTIGSYKWDNPSFIEKFYTRLAFACLNSQITGTPTIGYQTVVLSDTDAIAGGSFTTTVPAAATDAGYISFASRYGYIRGIKRCRIRDGNNTEVLLVGMDRALCVITGSSALDFIGSTISDEFGVVGNNTWAQVGDDTYFLATDGIRRLRTNSGDTGFQPELLSTGIQDIINRINKDAAYLSWSMYNPKTQELVFWVPIDSDTTPKNGIVLNFQKDRKTPVFSTISQQKLTAGIYFNGQAYGGTSDGYLEKLWTGNDFDGTTINWDFVSAVGKTNSPAQNASSRKFEIITEGGDQQYMAEAYSLTQRADEVTQMKLQYSKAMSVTKPSITKLGTWASGSTTSYSQFTDFQPMGSGRFWVCRLKGTGSGDYIDLVGVLFIEQLGGLRQ